MRKRNFTENKIVTTDVGEIRANKSWIVSARFFPEGDEDEAIIYNATAPIYGSDKVKLNKTLPSVDFKEEGLLCEDGIYVWIPRGGKLYLEYDY